MATLPQLPAIPSDNELTALAPERPDWDELAAMVEGLDGKDLVDAGSFGEDMIMTIVYNDTAVKDYLPQFLEAYWASPFGQVEKAAEQFAAIRLAEARRCKDFRNQAGIIIGAYKLEIDRRAEQKRRELEEEQRRQAEAEKQAELTRLEAEKAAQPAELQHEIQAAIEMVQQAPIIPTAISKQAAATAAGLPSAPPKVSGKRVYDRTVENWPRFLAWLAQAPAQYGLITTQSDGSYRISFAKHKASPIEIPGVKMTIRYETSNRGR